MDLEDKVLTIAGHVQKSLKSHLRGAGFKVKSVNNYFTTQNYVSFTVTKGNIFTSTTQYELRFRNTRHVGIIKHVDTPAAYNNIYRYVESLNLAPFEEE